MTRNRLPVVLATALALLAFAGNSLLTRAALAGGGIAPDSFAAIRLGAGAAMLLAIGIGRGLAVRPRAADLPGIIALFAYAAAFSRAYVSLGAATGALILFTSVQMTIVAGGLVGGAFLSMRQGTGILIALSGLAWLLAPGVTATPTLGAAALMTAAGVAWGVYTLIGRGSGAAIARTARNFIGTIPLALLLVAMAGLDGTPTAIMLAVASGAITSALGYVIWYSVLPSLPAVTAASLQLLVPVITALGSLIWLREPLTTTLTGASLLILAGVAMTLRRS